MRDFWMWLGDWQLRIEVNTFGYPSNNWDDAGEGPEFTVFSAWDDTYISSDVFTSEEWHKIEDRVNEVGRDADYYGGED